MTRDAAPSDAAVAAIEYALSNKCDGGDDAMEFLRYWNEGHFDIIQRNWEDVPEAVFIGADPLRLEKAPVQQAAPSGSIDTPEFMERYVAAACDMANRELYDELVSFIHMHVAQTVFACQREWEDAAAPAQPAGLSEQDKLDAARYRYLRDIAPFENADAPLVFYTDRDGCELGIISSTKMDAAIDSAILAAKEAP